MPPKISESTFIDTGSTKVEIQVYTSFRTAYFVSKASPNVVKQIHVMSSFTYLARLATFPFLTIAL